MSNASDEESVSTIRSKRCRQRRSIESDEDPIRCNTSSSTIRTRSTVKIGKKNVADADSASSENSDRDNCDSEKQLPSTVLESRNKKTVKRLTRSNRSRQRRLSASSADIASEESSGDCEEDLPPKVKRRKIYSQKKRQTVDSLRSQCMSGAARGLTREPRESQRDRFLELNGDSSLDDFIADDGESEEETEGSGDEESSSGAKKVVNSDKESIGSSDESSGSSDDSHTQEEKPESEGNKTTATSEKESEDEDVSPSKKTKSQPNRIHSDESENEDMKPVQSQTSSRGPEIVKRKGRRKTRRRVVVTDSQDLDTPELGEEEVKKEVGADETDSEAEEEEETDSEAEEEGDMSNFVVNDEDPVFGEDNAEPMFYPTIEYEMSSNLRMDQQQAFRVVMESMVNRALDEEFFMSQDFRETPAIGQAFKKIFSQLDVLVNDIKSSAWCKAFVAALDYTDFKTSKTLYGAATCEACCRTDRYATFNAYPSGYRYDKHSLKPLPATEDDTNQEEDDTNSELPARDKKKSFQIGMFCEQRCLLYHEVLHFKLSLLHSCKEKVNSHKFSRFSTERIVEELLVKNGGWIDDLYCFYNTVIRNAQEMIRKRSNLTKEEMF